MTLGLTGDLATTLRQQRDSAAQKLTLARLSREVTTGQAADPAQRLRGNLAALAGIDAAAARAAGFRTVAAEAQLILEGMQAAVGRIGDLADGLAADLGTAAAAGQPAVLDALGRDAAGRLEAAVGALNTRLGDRALFAGRATQGPALPSAAEILDGAAAAAAGAATADEAAAAVRAWFADPAGFGAAYAGGPPAAPLPLSPEDSLRLPVTAADPALAATLAGLAMAALLDRGLPAGDAAERRALARAAGETLAAGAQDRAGVAATLGLAQERVATADRRNAAEIDALAIARAGLLEVDPYASATALEAAQTRLETLHAVTARLARLSLVDFLR
jgi:flagellar hook-associated protein 3 FlgL